MGVFIHIENDEYRVIIDTRSKREKNLKAVRQRELDGSHVLDYPSIAAAQKLTGIKNISDCVLGKRQSAGGYLWEHIKEEHYE